jgi:Amt family ammonium transporter
MDGYSRRAVRGWGRLAGAAALTVGSGAWAQAAETSADSGDTAWMLVASALVLLMTPGLALFYGGMVRRKNVLATFMYSFFALALVTVQWVLFGYSLAFGRSHGGFIGGFDYLMLSGVEGPKGSIPHLAFMAFQLKFAIITPALISGAFAERMKFSAYVLFTLLWTTFVYDPVAHWTWAEGGWLLKMGVLDFAGGTVVHWTAGLSALVCALFIGRRLGYGRERFIPHDLPMAVMGAGLLWFGWFGFNAGSALAAGPLASLALVTTHIAAAAAAMSWTTAEWLLRGRPTLLGFISGLVAGLVAITPAAGFISPTSALLLGALAAFPSYFTIVARSRTRLDDSLDVFAGHGIGGITGALLTGVFASKVWNAAGNDGLLAGNAAQLGTQALGVVSSVVYSALATFVILKVMSLVTALRAAPRSEGLGMDVTQHGEEAYTNGEGSILVIPDASAVGAPAPAFTPQAVAR